MRWGQGRTPIAALAAAAVLLVMGSGLAAGRSEQPGAPSLKPASERARTTALRGVAAKGRSARLKTRHAFSDQSADEAIATAREHHRILRGRMWMAGRSDIVRFLGDRSALVRHQGETRIAAASIPLRTRDSADPEAAVDLSLVREDGAFRPRNGLVDVRIGTRPRDGIALPESGIGVQVLEGARDSTGQELGDRVYWPNVADDTDAIAMPTPTGVETFVQLRSARSPEALRMPFRLPVGGRIEADFGGRLRIVVGGTPVASIAPPSAWGADGAPVDVRATVEGDATLVLSVPHRAADVAYPVLVDPTIQAWPWYADWTFAASRPGTFTSLQYDGLLFIFFPSSGLQTSDTGTWSFPAPAGTYIEHANFIRVSIPAAGCARAGIRWGPTGWRSSGTQCGPVYPSSWSFLGPPIYSGDPSIALSLRWNAPQPYAGARLQFEGAELYYGDDNNPSASPVDLDQAWSRTAPASLRVTATDAGVGVKSVALAQRGTSWTSRREHACTGEPGSYCPKSWTNDFTLPALGEGRHRIGITPTDLQGRTASPPDAMIRVDSTAPSVTLSGPLRTAAGGFAEESALHVQAVDGTPAADESLAQRLGERSGVKTIELLVNGASVESTMDGTQQVTQACSAGSCALERDLDFDPERLATGTYAISVRATDQIGNTVTTTPFSVKVDKTAPTVALSGSLYDNAGSVLTPGDYELRIVADDGDATAAVGVDRVEVLVDGILHPTVVPADSCPEGPTKVCSIFTYTGDAFTPGRHDVSVVVTDRRGNHRTVPLVVYGHQELSPTAVAVGFEEHFALRSIAAGAGSSASVNLGSGNFTWHHRPISDAGRGPWTNVDVTYNSRSSELDLGHGYDEIGEGFSLAISSLTRVNEALDVRWVDKNNDKRNDVITLTDADGTMHRFKRRMNGTTATDVFDPPPGVNVHLRRFHASPQTVEQRRKVWAATLADGVTHFFDACGYERSVEDRNGNALTFTYEEEDCHAQTQGRRAKLLSVTDAGGRSLRLFYESGSPGTSSRIDYILDHENRKLDFTYYTNKKLQRITEATATADERSFSFAYEQTGQTAADKDVIEITDPRGSRTQIAYSDDHGGEASLAPKFGLGERVITLTDRRAKPMSFAYVPGTPYLETRLTDRRAKVWRYRTDTAFRLRELIDPLGVLTRFGWDPDNNLGQVDEAVGTPREAHTLMVWNANGQLLSHTDGELNRTQLTYRDNNGVHEAPSGIDTGGSFVSDLETITTARGTETAAADDFTTRLRYELAGDPAGTADRGNVRSVTDPEGFRSTFDYTSQGLLSRESAETDRGEYAVTTFEGFDGSGLPQLITDPRGNRSAEAGDGQWHVRYSVAGLTTRVTDPRGTAPGASPSPTQPYTTQYGYDALRRQVSVRIPKLSGGSTPTFIDRSTVYDDNDNVVRMVDGEGQATTRTFTTMDDVETETSPAVAHELDSTATETETTRFSYDAEQNVETIESPRGTRTATVDDFTTRYQYDAAGRRTVERRMSRGPVVEDLITSYGYDQRGNLIGVADPAINRAGGDPATNAMQDATQRISYVYDLADRRTHSIEHLRDLANTKLTTLLDHDATGNVIAVTDPRGAGHTTTYEYDARDLLTAEVDPEGGRTEYDLRGDHRVVRITKPNGTATAASGDFETHMNYDPMGDLLERTIPRADGHATGGLPWKVVYTRDEIGDPITITDGRDRSFSNTFFDTGDLKTTGRPSWWQFDGMGIGEGDPQAGPSDDDIEADAESTKPGMSAAGDFGDVGRRPLPGVIPRAGQTSFEYDDEMRLTSSTDAAGNRFELARDAIGRVSLITQPFDTNASISQRSRFDHNGNLRFTEDGEGHRTELVYDQFDRIDRRREPGAAIGAFEETVYRYDPNGNVREIQTPRGPQFTWRMTYDALDRLTSRTDPRGATISWEDFDAAGNPGAEISPRGNTAGLSATERARFTTRRTFDALNRVQTITDGLGHETRLDYDADSNLIEIVAPGAAPDVGASVQPQVTRISYDGRDLPYATTTTRDGVEHTRIREFDPNGNLRREITPRGVTRDPETNALTPRWPDSDDPRDPASNASKHATVFGYDSDNLLTAVHQPWGDLVAGDAFNDQNTLRFVQRFQRDERGRITELTPAFDPDDSEETAQIGKRRTRYTHFQNGWIKTATDPDHEGDGDATVRRLQYGYDRRGFQTNWRFERIENGGEPTLKREISRVFAPNGTLSSREARRPGRPSRTYAYTYNANRTLTSIADSDPEGEDHTGTRTTAITVNAAEQPVLVDETWSGGRDTTFRYDIAGNVIRRQSDGRAEPTTAPVDPEQPYTYTGADARTTAFTFDPLDRERTTAVCDSATSCSESAAGARVSRTDWYPSGQIERRSKPNGAVETRFYFQDGLISRMRRIAGGATQKDQAFRYDENGNRTQDERGEYLYSARDGLIKWTRKSGSSLSYRLLGSRAIKSSRDSAGISTDYRYSGDRLESAVLSGGGQSATVQFEYDELGAMRRMSQPAGSTEYQYDEFERLRRAKGVGVPATEDGDRYCYDALDRRALRIDSANTTDNCATADAASNTRRYSYVGLTNMLAREESDSGTTRTYDYDSSYRRLGRSKVGTGGYQSYAHDANGSVEGIEHADGTLPSGETYPYDPYGAVEPASGRTVNDPPNKGDAELATPDLKDNPFRFQGFYYDAGTQTYDVHARDYRPDIARFLSQDRFADAYRELALLSDPMNQNRYAFGGGNPVTHVEVDGHCLPSGSGPGPSPCYPLGRPPTKRERRVINRINEAHQTAYENGQATAAAWAAQEQIQAELRKARDQLALVHLDYGCRDYIGIPRSENHLSPCEAWLETDPGKRLREGVGAIITVASDVAIALGDASQGSPARPLSPVARGGGNVLRRLASLFPHRTKWVIGPYEDVQKITRGTEAEAHHFLQDAAVRNLPRYSRKKAPSIGLTGPASRRTTPHGRATQRQIDTALGGTLGDEVTVAIDALRNAGVPDRVIRKALKAADDYFIQELGHTLQTTTRIPGTRRNVP